MPTLAFLPHLTPMEESMKLLPVAYEALFTLCDTRFSGANERQHALKALQRVLRDGVLQGLESARNCANIVTVLLKYMGGIIERMGVHTVKYLKVCVSLSLAWKLLIELPKDIIPILSSILIDPFSCAQTTMLVETLRTLQVVILNGWPRVNQPVYCLELIMSVSLCWINTRNELQERRLGSEIEASLRDIVREILAVGNLMSACMNAADSTALLVPIFYTDSSLREVFANPPARQTTRSD